MSKKSKPYDPAEFLDTDEVLAEYITEAFATEDAAEIAHAIGVAARARKMAQIADDTGLSRESLYRALSEDGNPQLDTIVRVLSALGLQLRAEPCDPVDA
ncbi:MAG: putative addiction module antidote protein [Hyphomicrobium sp.]|nr:putative addiction module antidote protein [Hyphomicrobium sp.]